MLTREELRQLALESKGRLSMTWQSVAEAMGRSPVYSAFLAFGYGQATEGEATKLGRVLKLSEKAQRILQKVFHRSPAAPWPPTDSFIYRLYEVFMLYGPVFKDIAHELFGDSIMSAIDMSVDIEKKEDPVGVPRMEPLFYGKWLENKRL